MKSFKVSTTAQRKAALAMILKKITRGQRIGDDQARVKYGVSGLVSRLKAQGFIQPTDSKGIYAATESLTTWPAEDILDLCYKNKNAREKKIQAKLDQEPAAAPLVQTSIFKGEDVKIQVPNASGETVAGDETAEHIAAALRLADRYQVKNVAQFVADYLKDAK